MTKRYTRYPELVERLGLDPARIVDDSALELVGNRLHFHEVVVPREVVDGVVRREYRSVVVPPRVLAWWRMAGGA